MPIMHECDKLLFLLCWGWWLICYYYYYYYYWYSALGPVWAETRVQSGDWCATSWASSWG